MKITLETLSDILFELHPGDRIFLKGNLGSGKTTLSQALIRKYLGNPDLAVTSPTYTYYHTYPGNLYHFDLYRAQHSDDIIRIGAEEIFDNPDNICIIEWPEILGNTVQPTKIITLTEIDEGRNVTILDCQAGGIDNGVELPTISSH